MCTSFLKNCIPQPTLWYKELVRLPKLFLLNFTSKKYTSCWWQDIVNWRFHWFWLSFVINSSNNHLLPSQMMNISLMYLCQNKTWHRYIARSLLEKIWCSHPPQVQIDVGWDKLCSHCYALYLEVVGAVKTKNIFFSEWNPTIWQQNHHKPPLVNQQELALQLLCLGLTVFTSRGVWRCQGDIRHKACAQ